MLRLTWEKILHGLFSQPAAVSRTTLSQLRYIETTFSKDLNLLKKKKIPYLLAVLQLFYPEASSLEAAAVSQIW